MNKRITKISRNFLKYPAGSVLIETGNTKVICAVSIEENVPSFIKAAVQGWLTAEYSMMPGSSKPRSRREVSNGKVSGRTAEIQRLIGRSLRAVVDLRKIPGYTIKIDCDVMQADGGTRTAAITGACVALHDAFSYMIKENMIQESPLNSLIAAISVGLVDDNYILDLDYENDSIAQVDMNVVMTENGDIIEVQGTAEGKPFSRSQFNEMLDLAEAGIQELISAQKAALAIS
ncbi:MAG: ribonuclease PH [Candidatus Cloacimonetes bacterium]|nr:ribonuclease PH [Candidatus Cloacimonadota bacterium]